MSSGALLDQDFGSESEDDNFNPAPAEESDNEGADELENDVNGGSNADMVRRRSTDQRIDEDGDEDEQNSQQSPPERVNGRQQSRNGSLDPKSEDEEDYQRNQNGDRGHGDDDDEEEDEEDDDDEDAISVRLHPKNVVRLSLSQSRVGHVNGFVEIPEINSLMLRLRSMKKMKATTKATRSKPMAL